MTETLISSPQMADEVVRSPNFLFVRPSLSQLLTDERTARSKWAIPPVAGTGTTTYPSQINPHHLHNSYQWFILPVQNIRHV